MLAPVTFVLAARPLQCSNPALWLFLSKFKFFWEFKVEKFAKTLGKLWKIRNKFWNRNIMLVCFCRCALPLSLCKKDLGQFISGFNFLAERIFFRLTKRAKHGRNVLKGSALFVVWTARGSDNCTLQIFDFVCSHLSSFFCSHLSSVCSLPFPLLLLLWLLFHYCALSIKLFIIW